MCWFAEQSKKVLNREKSFYANKVSISLELQTIIINSFPTELVILRQ